MEWAFETRTFREMGLHGETAGSRGVDEAFASAWAPGIGVEIMGRKKFGPQRGPWEDEDLELVVVMLAAPEDGLRPTRLARLMRWPTCAAPGPRGRPGRRPSRPLKPQR